MQKLTCVLLTALAIAIAGCKNNDSTTSSSTSTAAPEASTSTWSQQAQAGPQNIEGLPDNFVILDQGWDVDTVQKYWFTAQGSEMIPRAWLLALERPNGERFATAATFDRYRYIPATPTAYNEDGWPVGFTISKDPASGTEWFGYTCAGCHTGRLDYGGKSVILTGGSTLANLTGLLGDMIAEMQATAMDDARFTKFANQILGPNASPYAREQLKNSVVSLAGTMLVRKNGMVDSGYGRLDAFGTIFSEVMAVELDLPNNQRFADAAVSYPFIWDSSHTDRVQWNGSVSNRFPGPIGRNVAEILGVFGQVTIDPSRPVGYASSINFKGLGDIEKWLKGLYSPLWPEGILPALDQAKVARGKKLYAKQCESCHEVLKNRTNPHRKIYAKMMAIGAVGTDPRMATNFAQRTGLTGRLQGKPMFYVGGKKMGAEEQGMSFIDNVAAGAMAAQPDKSLKAAFEDYEGMFLFQGKYDPIKDPAYKARPLNGAWATAPYLHNGSVANLWDLMQPPDKRMKSFHVGSYNFDPVKVGYETGPSPISSLFTATGTGNSNGGHTMGTQLTDPEKWDIIEYIKSL